MTSRPLTSREIAAVERVALGLTVDQAAAALNRSPHTVKTQLARALAKLDAHNRTHLIVLAARRGIIDIFTDCANPHHHVDRWHVEVRATNGEWHVVNPTSGGFTDRQSARDERVKMESRSTKLRFRCVKTRTYYMVDRGDGGDD